MKRLGLLVLEIGLLLGLGVWVYLSITETNPIQRPGGVEVTVQLPDAWDKAVLYRKDDRWMFAITEHSGRVIDMTADELAARMHRDRTERSWGQKLLNVSNPFGYVWVSLGFLGQLLFTGRMVVQWLVSEKNKKSVVPPIFWWMSLAGSTMLMLYFLWRRDPIGLLGQSFGWFIYVRNLWMIYRPQTPHHDNIMTAEEVESQTPLSSRT
ncbi:MAG: hypothetical protein KatS3mg104_2673 [Phycisphaerae bacterium]|jgi:lipid-A-disaccharide synthase-like uncharacterized protein|nr:MAG: hypothetical protein KatS3mg104_2673 [Phycisphaerae bacterium]